MSAADPYEIDIRKITDVALKGLFEDLIAESIDYQEQAEYVEAEIRRRDQLDRRKSKEKPKNRWVRPTSKSLLEQCVDRLENSDD